MRGTKIQVGAVDTSKIADQTLLREDAVPGTLVTAYARINNPPGDGNAAIASGSAVNVPDIDVINEALGNFIVTFNGLPGGSLATCTITAQPVVSPSTLGTLPKTTVTVRPAAARSPPAPPRSRRSMPAAGEPPPTSMSR